MSDKPVYIEKQYIGREFIPMTIRLVLAMFCFAAYFFTTEKVPLPRKKEIPLLINGNGDIIWVGGYRPDERYKVSDKTKKVTIFELFKK